MRLLCSLRQVTDGVGEWPVSQNPDYRLVGLPYEAARNKVKPALRIDAEPRFAERGFAARVQGMETERFKKYRPAAAASGHME
jgi:hypothetical protein